MYPSAKRKRPPTPAAKGDRSNNAKPFEPAKLSQVKNGNVVGPSSGLDEVDKDERGTGRAQ